MTDEEWHAGMEVYLLNVVRIVRLVTPHMQQQGGGSIVNISTYATFEPEALFPTSGVFPCGPGSVHQAVRRRVCVRRDSHEQRAAGVH